MPKNHFVLSDKECLAYFSQTASLKGKMLTSGSAAIQLNPHCNVTSPASWVQSDKTGFDRWDNWVEHCVVYIIITTEKLKIENTFENQLSLQD